MQAKRGLKWAQGAGLPLDYNDMFQEASIAFLLAAEGYDPNAGVKFSAYYTMAAFSQFRKSIGIMSGVKNLNPGQREEIADRKAENARRIAAGERPLPECNYGLRPKLFSEMDGNDESSEFTSFQDSLVSDAPSPESILAERQVGEEVLLKLSPLACLIAELLREPPEELLRELDCQLAHRHEANESGGATFNDGVTVKDVCRFLQVIAPDLKDKDVRRAKTELIALRLEYDERNKRKGK